MNHRLLVSSVCLIATVFGAPAPSPKAKAAARVLAENCSACHSAEVKSSGFSVADLDAVIAGGKKHGRAVLGGQPEKSPLVAMLKGDIAPRMPMGKNLAPDDIAAIEAWIRELPADSQPVNAQDWRWPYQKPVKNEPPSVRNSAWVNNPIDAFILADLENRVYRRRPELRGALWRGGCSSIWWGCRLPLTN